MAAARAATDVVAKRVQLLGLAIPVAQHVDVTVSTDPTEIIAETTRRLLLADAERQHQLPANIIEGEVIA